MSDDEQNEKPAKPAWEDSHTAASLPSWWQPEAGETKPPAAQPPATGSANAALFCAHPAALSSGLAGFDHCQRAAYVVATRAAAVDPGFARRGDSAPHTPRRACDATSPDAERSASGDAGPAHAPAGPTTSPDAEHAAAGDAAARQPERENEGSGRHSGGSSADGHPRREIRPRHGIQVQDQAGRCRVARPRP